MGKYHVALVLTGTINVIQTKHQQITKNIINGFVESLQNETFTYVETNESCDNRHVMLR